MGGGTCTPWLGIPSLHLHPLPSSTALASFAILVVGVLPAVGEALITLMEVSGSSRMPATSSNNCSRDLPLFDKDMCRDRYTGNCV